MQIRQVLAQSKHLSGVARAPTNPVEVQPGHHQHGLISGRPPGEGLGNHQALWRVGRQRQESLHFRPKQGQGGGPVGFGKQHAPVGKLEPPGPVDAAPAHRRARHQAAAEPI